jgi:hypothetical protein
MYVVMYCLQAIGGEVVCNSESCLNECGRDRDRESVWLWECHTAVAVCCKADCV